MSSLMVSKVTLLQMPCFKNTYKKLHKPIQTEVDNAIRAIVKDPKIGTEKKGGLAGVFVYKFKVQKQEILLAYEWDSKTRLLMALGVHENFYRDLKKYR